MTPVREFHVAAAQAAADHPTIPAAETVRLRIRLIKEEYAEVMEHLEWMLHHQQASIPERLERLQALLGELCDLRYVLEGTAVSCGLPIDEAYADIHRANMSKRWPGEQLMRRDAGGKVLKGPNFQPADLSRYVHVVEGEAQNV